MLAETRSDEFVISRVFEAPRELVFECFTDPERMQHWWGPKGCKIIAAKMDLRVGGTYLGAMRDPSGRVMWAKFVYREVNPPERLVWIHSFSDEAGALARHPLTPTWPLQLLSTVTFEAQPGNKTKVTISWSPINATPEEQQTFDEGHANMQQGWSGTLDQLDAYLASTQ